MTRIKKLGAAAIALLAIGGTACGRSGAGPARAGEQASAPAAALPQVAVASPEAVSLESRVEVPGSFVPFEDAAIAAEAAGPVTMVRIEEGTRVAGGEVVVRLDATKAELGVRQAEAMLAQARANYERSKSDLGRKQTLLGDKTIPPSVFDAFKAQYDAAAAGVEVAKRRLADMAVTVPFGGVVRDKGVSVGQYVREGDTLFVLMRVDPLKLQFDLPEKYAGRLAAGQEIRATVVALPGREFTGTIQTVFPSVAVQSRTIRVEARVPNPGYGLKPGFSATVRVPLARLPGSLVIPRSAVVRREGTENVFVLKGDRAELAPIQTGIETADRVEVISGLGPADRVIVSGADTLRPGDRVQVKG